MRRFLVGEDGHQSHYDLTWIQSYNRPEVKPETILWSGNECENELPFVTTQNDKLDVNEMKKLIQSILQYGVAMIHDVGFMKTFKITSLILYYKKYSH